MTYSVIRVDGSNAPFTPASKRPSLTEIQGIVGGWIERVTVPGGEMWVNEEGLLIGLLHNPSASRLAGKPIVGDVLLCLRKRRA